jgi:hypothetical protein
MGLNACESFWVEGNCCGKMRGGEFMRGDWYKGLWMNWERGLGGFNIALYTARRIEALSK